MTRHWNIGIAGLGTVGGALQAFLQENPGFAPGGDRALVAGLSARTQTRPDGSRIAHSLWFDDPVVLAASPKIDVFVELMGGDETAKTAVETALRAGKPVVTANKALMANHGLDLARLAEAHGAPLLFEAAVMGGTPAVKIVREALVGDDIQRIAGILNGTSNFILTEMERSERGFAEVLREAQALGYAEADPTSDVEGLDAGHKITLLAALAFGCAPTFDQALVEGISGIDLLDIKLARDLGYRIKLIASAVRDAHGIAVRVHPALTRLDDPMARTSGVMNALTLQTLRAGRLFIQGPGAGGAATAMALAADIADVMTGSVRPVFGAPAARLDNFLAAKNASTPVRAYIRMIVVDQRGVIAAISEALAEAGVSIDSFLQKPVSEPGRAPIVLTTHPVQETVLNDALRHIAALPVLLESPRLIRLAEL
jgi:homoserine dehydrogenase